MNTYKKAGVDIKKGDKFVSVIKKMTKSLNKNKILGGIGGFGGAFPIDKKYKQPILISGTDGVGTKLKLAFMLNTHNTVGIDLVAMCINDIITCGAKPLFFLDYFATGKLSLKQSKEVIKGIVKGCLKSNCLLLGGETAEMPGFYKKGEYDLAGFAVGIVEKSKMITGRSIKKGNILVGIPSSGLHSNGFSLVRKAFNNNDLKKYGKKLLIPTRIYVNEIEKLLQKKLALGFAHITGGGLYENIPRILSKNLKIKINKNSWKIPEIFKLIQKKGKIKDSEMYKVFNMGIGMVVVAKKNDFRKIKKLVNDAVLIGEVIY